MQGWGIGCEVPGAQWQAHCGGPWGGTPLSLVQDLELQHKLLVLKQAGTGSVQGGCPGRLGCGRHILVVLKFLHLRPWLLCLSQAGGP